VGVLKIGIPLAIAFAAGCLPAAELPPQPPETAPPSIREVGIGEWTVGAIRLSKTRRMVSLPAKVKLTDGLLEYVLVHKTGKTHESMFSTDVPPYHLQVAMLLLGAKGAGPDVLTNAPPGGPISNAELMEYKPKPVPGEEVEISIRWQSNGTNVVHHMQDLVMNKKTGKPMANARWVFSGSMVWEGAFIAQIEGSIMSIITDISAMFNSHHPERDRDSLWFVRENVLPADGSAVTIEINLVNKIETGAGKSRPLKKHDEKK